MLLAYNFSEEEKKLMLQVVENYVIECMLKLDGKSVFFLDEAIYLSQRVKPFSPSLAARIKQHPGYY